MADILKFCEIKKKSVGLSHVTWTWRTEMGGGAEIVICGKPLRGHVRS